MPRKSGWRRWGGSMRTSSPRWWTVCAERCNGAGMRAREKPAMSQDPDFLAARVNGTPPPAGSAPAAFPSAATFREDFGEELATVLNLDTWRSGRNLSDEYRRIDAEVQYAVE